MAACGLDFGTSNSTLAVAQEGRAHLVPLEGDHITLPSAIFLPDQPLAQALYGRAAMESYLGGNDGRLLRSIKSILGTDLIDQETALPRGRTPFRAILQMLLRHIKVTAEARAGRPLDTVVHGRPVHFVDNDPVADQRAESVLADIAKACGFKEISFQFEPIAAALTYEETLDRENLALIADIGGGTSDFSVVRLGPQRRTKADRAPDVLSNGGLRLGGTDLDKLLSLSVAMPKLGYRAPLRRKGLRTPNHLYHDLSTWSRIPLLNRPSIDRELRDLEEEALEPTKIFRLRTVIEDRLGHAVAHRVEKAKIALSDSPVVTLPLEDVEKGLLVPVTAQQLQDATTESLSALTRAVTDCLDAAGVDARTPIDTVVFTGGSTLLPAVRTHIMHALHVTNPTVHTVDADLFGAVGMGLGLEAARRYGPAA